MRTRRKWPLVLLLPVVLLLACSMMPKTFIRTLEPGFKEIPVRDDVVYDRAWDLVTDAIAKKFDIEVLEKADGYLRTGWAYYTTGQLLEKYRVRITIKFNPAHDQVTVKTEAQYLTSTGWIMGYDIGVLTDVYNDIQGKIGRVIK